MAGNERLWVVRNPPMALTVSFAALILLGTMALSLPIAVDGTHPGIVDTLFLAASAVTVTCMTTFPVSELSLFGELVVLLLIQVGGFGIMTIGTLIGLVTTRRLGLRQRALARTEIGAVDDGEVRALVGSILRITLVVELTVAVVLGAALLAFHDRTVLDAVYEGTYLAVTSFNNAGIVVEPNGIAPFANDPLFIIVMSGAIILGGLGFPVILQFARRVRPSHWTLHTKLVILASAALLVVAPVVIGAFEWTNPATLGPMDIGDKLLAAWFQGVSPRSAGFATVDVAALNETTLLTIIALMFIGAGPASTGGGIRITTFAVLGFVLWSVVRGDADTHAFGRRIPPAVIRQAITVVLLSIGAVVGATLLLLAWTSFQLTPTLFETTSAFGTVGMTMGITDQLPSSARLVLILLMLAGRVGPITLVAALALRERPRLYQYPDERPIVG